VTPAPEVKLIVGSNESLQNAICKAILNKECYPSVRGIKESFKKATRKDIQDVQGRLIKAGLAEPYRGGIRLIA